MSRLQSALLFGERRGSSPQLRAPPRRGRTEIIVLSAGSGYLVLETCIECLRSPPSHNPSPCFHLRAGSFAMLSCLVASFGSALVFSHRCPSGNSPSALVSVLAPHHPCAHRAREEVKDHELTPLHSGIRYSYSGSTCLSYLSFFL
jgi:hypothetical protein